MSLPLEIEQAFADVYKQIADNHKGIRRSMNRLRQVVVGHYNGVRAQLDLHSRRLDEQGAAIEELALKVEELGKPNPRPPPTQTMKFGAG